MHRQSNILVVEDELIIAESLKLMLLNYGYKQIDIASSYDDAIELMNKNEYGLALLDINLGKGKNEGIQIGNYINEKGLMPHIYITANDDDATLEVAKESAPFGYIVKPYNKATVKTSIEIAMSNWQPVEQYKFTVVDNSKNVIIDLADVKYIESADGYANFIYSSEEQYLHKITLRTLLDQHLPNFFFQIHRKYLVNLNAVEEYAHDFVKVNNQKLPISRGYRKEARALLKQLRS